MPYFNLYVVGHKDSISWVKKSFDQSDRRASSLQLHYGSSYNRFCMLYVDLLVILSSFNGVKLCKREKIVFLTKSARVRTFLKLHLQLQILHRYLQEKLTYFQERFVSFVIF